jgi:hypothetical protein
VEQYKRKGATDKYWFNSSEEKKGVSGRGIENVW